MLQKLCTGLCLLLKTLCPIPSLYLGSLRIWACPLLVSPPLLGSSKEQTSLWQHRRSAAINLTLFSNSLLTWEGTGEGAGRASLSHSRERAGHQPAARSAQCYRSSFSEEVIRLCVGADACAWGAAGSQPGNMSSSRRLVSLASFHLPLLFSHR